MTRFAPVLVHSAETARPSGQMSRQKAFAPEGGRGRKLSARRRVQARLGHPVAQPEVFATFWANLLTRKCGCAAGVAQEFGCTEQTGRNWLAGTSCPIGHQVWHAMQRWPDAFSAQLAA